MVFDIIRPVMMPMAAHRGPPATGGGSDYAELSREVKQAGLLNRRPGYYTVKVGGDLFLLAAEWAAFTLIVRSWWQLLVAVFPAVMFTQTVFIGHDAGHQQISGSKRVNNLLGRLHGNLLVGLSYGWWISKHNRHHAHPNQVDRDPDIGDGAIAFTQDMPGPAVDRALAGSPPGLAVLPHAASGGPQPARRRRAGAARPHRHLTDGQTDRDGFADGPHRWLPHRAVLGSVARPGSVFPDRPAGIVRAVHGCSFAPNQKGMPILAKDDKTGYLCRQVLTARNIRGGRFTDVGGPLRPELKY